MPVDPKYANLPGIARNQADVYETNDLPESDQDQEPRKEEFESDAVESSNLSAQEALQKFKGKTLDASQTDFSDRIRVGGRYGYVNRKEYEIEGPDVQETIDQKFQRLQMEVAQLTEEVKTSKEKLNANEASDALDPVAMANQIDQLLHQMTELNLDILQGDSDKVNLADPQGSLQKRLMQELEAFQPAGAEEKGGAPANARQGDHVTYELYYRPDQAKFSSSARAAALEQRLERLEALLGNNPDKLSILGADMANKGLVGAVGLLSSKLKVLDPVQVEHMDGRLLAINQRLSQIAEKKEAQATQETQNKISELYNIVKKWDAVADNLPQITDRLVALGALHQEAMQFGQAVANLDTAQKEIVSHLKSQGELLQQVEGKLQNNMENVKKTIESFDKRISALSSK